MPGGPFLPHLQEERQLLGVFVDKSSILTHTAYKMRQKASTPTVVHPWNLSANPGTMLAHWICVGGKAGLEAWLCIQAVVGMLVLI